LGSKGRNPTRCSKNPTTRNASGTPNVEESGPTNQHQRPFSAFPTGTGKPVTLKPGTTYPSAETPGVTPDAGNEAAVVGTSRPHPSKTTNA